MPDAHESCRNAPSQPHKCSRFTVYIKPSGKTQECICFLARKFTEVVRTVSTRANWAGILRRGAGAQADGIHGGLTVNDSRRISRDPRLSRLEVDGRLF